MLRDIDLAPLYNNHFEILNALTAKLDIRGIKNTDNAAYIFEILTLRSKMNKQAPHLFRDILEYPVNSAVFQKLVSSGMCQETAIVVRVIADKLVAVGEDARKCAMAVVRFLLESKSSVSVLM